MPLSPDKPFLYFMYLFLAGSSDSFNSKLLERLVLCPGGRGWGGGRLGLEGRRERGGGRGRPSLRGCRSALLGREAWMRGEGRCLLSLPEPRAARLLRTGVGQVPLQEAAVAVAAHGWPGQEGFPPTWGASRRGAAIGRAENEPHTARGQGVHPRSSVTEGDLPPGQDPPGLSSKRLPPEVPTPPPASGDSVLG